MRKNGFTLVELAFVLAVLGMLVAMTVPAYQSAVRRAQATEAAMMVEHIANAELTHRRDHGKFLACGASAGTVPAGVQTTFDATGCWKDLGVAVEGPVRFVYRVELDGESFRVLGEGDLDGDGETSLFTLTGASLALAVKDPLE